MTQYYNYIKIITDLHKILMSDIGKEYKSTIMTMMDESVYHFLESHKVPQERQAEFLNIMFPDCPDIVAMYKTKKFN